MVRDVGEATRNDGAGLPGGKRGGGWVGEVSESPPKEVQPTRSGSLVARALAPAPPTTAPTIMHSGPPAMAGSVCRAARAQEGRRW